MISSHPTQSCRFGCLFLFVVREWMAEKERRMVVVLASKIGAGAGRVYSSFTNSSCAICF